MSDRPIRPPNAYIDRARPSIDDGRALLEEPRTSHLVLRNFETGRYGTKWVGKAGETVELPAEIRDACIAMGFVAP